MLETKNCCEGRKPHHDRLFDNIIWGIDDVCYFTKYAKGTIYNLVSKGEIPYRRGRKRKLIFIPSEIIDWLKGE
ncbi:MAG: helix-turn-helix domain-containing protein [Bdellovibrionales bacterium]|nr:helix-turn-helix domain-containing protein [Bdellovibrionales bacterium]